jgi:hypothetical protein
MAEHKDSSPWRLFCIGVVSENKPLDTNNILFVPLEKTGMMQGQVVSNPQGINLDSVDSQGNPFNTTAKTDSSLEAEWMPEDTLRDTAPDVQRNEQVWVYTYADTGKYFWREKFDQKKKRRKETIRLSASASSDAGEFSVDSHYYMELSGHKGSFNVQTSKANGEKSNYQFTIDALNGQIILGDGEGNRFNINTVDTIVSLMNAMETAMQLNGRDFMVKADENGIMAFANMLIDLKETGTINAGQVLELVAAEGIYLNAKDLFLNGITHLNGPIVQDDGAAGGYDAKLKGPLRVDNDVIAKGVSTADHDHDETGNRTKKPNPI